MLSVLIVASEWQEDDTVCGETRILKCDDNFAYCGKGNVL